MFNYGSTILKNDLYYIKLSAEGYGRSAKSSIVITHGLKPSDTLSTLFLKNIVERLKNRGESFVDYLLEHHDIYLFSFINTDGILFGNSVSNIAGSNLYELNKNSKFIQKELVSFLKQINKIPNILLLLNLSVDFGL